MKDERMQRYMAFDASPPKLTTAMLLAMQQKRDRRWQMILLCIASFLWALVLGLLCWQTYLFSHALGLLMIGALLFSLLSAGAIVFVFLYTHKVKEVF